MTITTIQKDTELNFVVTMSSDEARDLTCEILSLTDPRVATLIAAITAIAPTETINAAMDDIEKKQKQGNRILPMLALRLLRAKKNTNREE